MVSVAAGQRKKRRAKAPAATPQRTKFDPRRDAEKDIHDAITRAQKTGQHIILDVGGEWCKWCLAMDNFFLQETELTAYRDKNYLWVKVNFSPENENEKVLSRYPPISGYPHLYFLDSQGEFLHSADTSLLEKDQSYDKEKFLSLLQQYAPTKLN